MSEGWVKTTLGEVLERTSELQGHSQIELVLSVTEKNGIRPQTEVFKKRIATDDTSKYKVLRPLDIAYNPYLLWTGAVGQWLGQDLGVTSPVYECFRAKAPNDPRFVGLILESGILTPYFDSTAIGSIQRRRRTTTEVFAAAPVEMPPAHEQRRIADLISSIDLAIDTAQRLPSLANTLWRSLIDTETDGLDLTTLIKVVDTAKAGGTPNRKRPEFYGGSIPWLKSGEVANGRIIEAEESITSEGLANSSAWLVPSESVLVAMYGATAGAVGYLVTPMSTNQAVLALRGHPEKVDQRFLFHWLRSRSASMKDRATGAAQPNLSKSRVLEEPFPVMEIRDQEKVAAMLDGVLGTGSQAESFVKAAEALRSEVLADLLSGARGIPDSYDRFLEEAS
jgi:type I restriction enzyme S subunit